jgi:hypothetical protein
MSRYYFFDTLLPPLIIGRPVEMGWPEFSDLAQQNLMPGDLHRLRELRLWYDLQNLRPLWLEQPLQPYGNYSQEGLETALATDALCSPLVEDFMAAHKDVKERVRYLPQLLTSYLERLSGQHRGFLKWLGGFERHLRLLLVALRARGQGMDLLQAFYFQDPRDPFVAFLIAQRGSEFLVPPLGFEEVGKLWESFHEEPLQIAEGLLRFKVGAIEEAFRDKRFTIDHVLGYAQRLILIEQLELGDPTKAQLVVNSWLRQLPTGAVGP